MQIVKNIDVQIRTTHKIHNVKDMDVYIIPMKYKLTRK